MEIWQTMTGYAVRAHKYEYENGNQYGEMEKIEAKLKERGFNEILELVRAHEYGGALEWIYNQ